MSSWASSQPSYPPRERSRSPSRGAYGRVPYPDPSYQDGYRGDWEAYDRERWAYERDRGYDGRPALDDGTLVAWFSRSLTLSQRRNEQKAAEVSLSV
jgi:hypothetical protein